MSCPVCKHKYSEDETYCSDCRHSYCDNALGEAVEKIFHPYDSSGNRFTFDGCINYYITRILIEDEEYDEQTNRAITEWLYNALESKKKNVNIKSIGTLIIDGM